ncbi:MAG: hypothetical protein IPF77_11055 [Gemmatimonadetes bacterium]|nr:hypothetical protein [Gemmatimonadota bacterium]
MVDDDPMVRRVATGSLESLGYQIVAAETASWRCSCWSTPMPRWTWCSPT